MAVKSFRRRIAQLLWWVSLALIITGLVLWLSPGMAFMPPGILVGSGIVVLGLNLLIGGELIVGAAPRGFTARGQVVRGMLHVKAGLADLAISAGANDRIAAVRYGPMGKPGFSVEGGTAYLYLKNAFLRPNISRWQAGLATNVLWDVNARSSLGNLRLDLRSLRLEQVTAHTTLGQMLVACPARGYVRMALSTGVGEISVTIPPDVGAQVVLDRGALTTLEIKNKRLLIDDQHRYATPDYETAAAQVELHIRSAAGDIILK